MILLVKNCILLLVASLILVTVLGQYYTPYNPYYTPNPTFSSLNSYSYYTTPYPYYYSTYTTPYPSYTNTKIRIWPYVIGQYLYPSYYNSNYYNPYASLSTPNWQSYYSNVYQMNWGRK